MHHCGRRLWEQQRALGRRKIEHSYPSRVCCHWLGAMPAQHMKASERAHEDTSPAKIDVTSKSPVGDISVVTLIRTDTTLDHSQKAEKVCSREQARRVQL